MMFINTETLAKVEGNWNSHTLFDTQTGLSYTLAWFVSSYGTADNDVFLHVISANTPGSEYTGGIKFYGQEAVDFWQKLAAVAHGESNLPEWMAAKAELAQSRLEAIQKADAERVYVPADYSDDLPY